MLPSLFTWRKVMVGMHELNQGETVHHISSTRPIAKRLYKCSCCNQPILIGEKHHKNIYKLGNDPKIRWERSHIKCPGW
jgi:hypothetical protein